MTKVLFGETMLAYRRDMRETLRQVIRSQFIDGVRVRSRREPPLAQMDLLPPPMIHMLDLDIYDGKIDDVILITASNDFGIQDLHVMIHDGEGNLIKSGEALDGNDGFGTWCYFAEVSVPSGTPVVVRAIATDGLGSVGALCAARTIP